MNKTSYNTVKLSNRQLLELKDSAKEHEIWSVPLEALNEPSFKLDILNDIEAGEGVDFKDYLKAIDEAQEAHVQCIKVSNEKPYKLLADILGKNKMADIIYDSSTILFQLVTSEESLPETKDLQLIIDSLSRFSVPGTTILWQYQGVNLKKNIAELFIIYLINGDSRTDEMVNDLLDEINDIELGDLKNELIKEAEKYAKEGIEEPELHKDAVLCSMADFLHGAEATIKLMNNK